MGLRDLRKLSLLADGFNPLEILDPRSERRAEMLERFDKMRNILGGPRELLVSPFNTAAQTIDMFLPPSLCTSILRRLYYRWKPEGDFPKGELTADQLTEDHLRLLAQETAWPGIDDVTTGPVLWWVGARAQTSIRRRFPLIISVHIGGWEYIRGAGYVFWDEVPCPEAIRTALLSMRVAPPPIPVATLARQRQRVHETWALRSLASEQGYTGFFNL